MCANEFKIMIERFIADYNAGRGLLPKRVVKRSSKPIISDEFTISENITEPKVECRMQKELMRVLPSAAAFISNRENCDSVKEQSRLIESFRDAIDSRSEFDATVFASHAHEALEEYKKAAKLFFKKRTDKSAEGVVKKWDELQRYIDVADFFIQLKTSFEMLPSMIKNSEAMKDVGEELRAIEIDIKKDKLNPQNLYLAGAAFSSILSQIWISSQQGNVKRIMNAVRKSGSIEPDVEEDINKIERHLSGESEIGGVIQIMSRRMSLLAAAMQMSQVINSEGMAKLSEMKDADSRFLSSLRAVESWYTSSEVSDALKMNPDVIFAALVEAGIVDMDKVTLMDASKWLKSLSETSAMLRRGKQAGVKECSHWMRMMLGSAAREIGSTAVKQILDGIEKTVILNRDSFIEGFKKKNKIDALVDGTYYDYSHYEWTKRDGFHDRDFTEIREMDGYAKIDDDDDPNLEARETCLAKRDKLVEKYEAEYDAKLEGKTSAQRALLPSEGEFVKQRLREYYENHAAEYESPKRIMEANKFGIRQLTSDEYGMRQANDAWKVYQRKEIPKYRRALRSAYESIRPRFVDNMTNRLIRVESIDALLKGQEWLAEQLNNPTNSPREAVILAAKYLRECDRFESMVATVGDQYMGPVKVYPYSHQHGKNFLDDIQPINSRHTTEEIQERFNDLAHKVQTLNKQMELENVGNTIAMFYIKLAIIAISAGAGSAAVSALGIKEGTFAAYLVDATAFSVTHQTLNEIALGQGPSDGVEFVKNLGVDSVTLGAVRGAKLVKYISGYNPAVGYALLESGAKLSAGVKLTTAEWRGLAASLGAYRSVGSAIVDDLLLRLPASYVLLHAGGVVSHKLGFTENSGEFFDIDSALTLALLHMRGKLGGLKVKKIRFPRPDPDAVIELSRKAMVGLAKTVIKIADIGQKSNPSFNLGRALLVSTQGVGIPSNVSSPNKGSSRGRVSAAFRRFIGHFYGMYSILGTQRTIIGTEANGSSLARDKKLIREAHSKGARRIGFEGTSEELQGSGSSYLAKLAAYTESLGMKVVPLGNLKTNALNSHKMLLLNTAKHFIGKNGKFESKRLESDITTLEEKIAEREKVNPRDKNLPDWRELLGMLRQAKGIMKILVNNVDSFNKLYEATKADAEAPGMLEIAKRKFPQMIFMSSSNGEWLANAMGVRNNFYNLAELAPVNRNNDGAGNAKTATEKGKVYYKAGRGRRRRARRRKVVIPEDR